MMPSSKYKVLPARYLSPAGRNTCRASEGCLRWLGGNVGLAFPVRIDAIDDAGNVFGMSLAELLPRLDEFEGRRGNVRMSDDLLELCFSAYENGKMSVDEKRVFEAFVREKSSAPGGFKAAKRLSINRRKMLNVVE